MMSRTLTLSFLLATLTFSSACGKKGEDTPAPKAATCETLVEKATSCIKDASKGEDKAPTDDDISKFKDMIATECKESSEIDAKAYAPVLACGTMDSCEDAMKCFKKEGKAFKKATKHVKITKDVAEKKFKEHKYFCKDVAEGKEEGVTPEITAACKAVLDGLAAEEAALVQEDIKAKKFKDSTHKYDCERALKGEEPAADSLKAACKEFYTAWTTELATAITTERDAATPDTKSSSDCYTFSSASKTLGGDDAEKKAKLLCEEHGLAIRAAKTIQDVDKAIADKKTSGAYSCKITLEAFDKIDSDFAKAKKEVVFNKCNVEFNKFILETELPNITKYVCPFQIKNVLKAATELNLAGKDPKLDELIKTASADEKCTK
jgi:hypothetical protein